MTPDFSRLTPAEKVELAILLEAKYDREHPPTYLEFVTSTKYCGLTPSDMMGAIMLASQGEGDKARITNDQAKQYFGCHLSQLPTTPPRVVAIHAGARAGKSSRLLGTKALHAAWTVPLPTLSANEHAVSLIVSSDMAFARQTLRFVQGYIEQSRILSKALVGKATGDCITLRRPDGKLVDIRVRAAGGKGKGGRAATLVGAFLDEAAFFYDESGVVSDKDIFDACLPRIVPGGQLWMASTPWIEGVGVLEELLAKNYGNHTTALAIRGVPTRVLNPGFDPDGSIRATQDELDPDNARREFDAISLTSGSHGFLSRESIEFAADKGLPQRSPFDPTHQYGAGADTGFRRNSSVLAIVERIPGATANTYPTYRVALLEERIPTSGVPLQPRAVVGEFAALMKAYGLKSMSVDSHEADEVKSALLASGCSATPAPPKEESYVLFRSILHEGRIKFPNNPRLRQQLRDLVSKPQPGGGVSIVSPQRADGSHGDLVSALVAAVWQLAHPNTSVPRGRTFNL